MGEGTQPLARLRRLILQIYSSDDDQKQLSWMLRRAAPLGDLQKLGLLIVAHQTRLQRHKAPLQSPLSRSRYVVPGDIIQIGT